MENYWCLLMISLHSFQNWKHARFRVFLIYYHNYCYQGPCWRMLKWKQKEKNWLQLPRKIVSIDLLTAHEQRLLHINVLFSLVQPLAISTPLSLLFVCCSLYRKEKRGWWWWWWDWEKKISSSFSYNSKKAFNKIR